MQKGKVMAHVWKDNKVVTNTNTQPSAAEDGFRVSAYCPQSVIRYNKCMGASRSCRAVGIGTAGTAMAVPVFGLTSSLLKVESLLVYIR